MKNLIGKKVRGFKFGDAVYNGIAYVSGMDEYIGKIGVIIYHGSVYCSVDFNGSVFMYPTNVIEQYLVEDSVSDTDEAIISAIVDAYLNGTSLPQIRESIRQAYTAIEAGVNAQLVEIKEERGKI